MTMTDDRRTTRWAIGGYLGLWALSTLYLAARGADWSFPIISLILFAVILSALAWALTRNSRAPAVPVARPKVELGALLAYLALYAFIVLGWLLGVVREVVPAGPAQEVAVLGFKLLVHVGLPLLLLLALRAPVAALFDSGIDRPGFWPCLILFAAILIGIVALASPSLDRIAALRPSLYTLVWGLSGAFVWNALEAGLNEEFLFRAVLQSRLQAVLQSPAAAIAIAAILFALAHAPGLYLRGTPDTDGWSTDPLQVAAFTIATLSPIAVMFGVIWARTRSLLLVVLLHACVDLLPFTSEFIGIWG